VKIRKRHVFGVCALALGVLCFQIIRGNLRTDAFWAAVRKTDVATARRLLEQRPDLISTPIVVTSRRPGEGGWWGQLPIHLAVGNFSGGSVEMTDTLLGFGADLNVRLDGDTLLHLAAGNGDLPIMTWLLDKGADVNARNGCEHHAEAKCKSGEFADWSPFDRQRSGGTRCNGCKHEGETPLHAAQRSIKQYEASARLLSRGADVQAVDAAGRTPLHIAAQEARASQDPRVLCSYGADPGQRDRSGKTPADLAREADDAKVIERYAATGPGELAGWLQPGGGCAGIAARARPGTPVPMDEVDAAWAAYVCTRVAERTPGCAKE